MKNKNTKDISRTVGIGIGLTAAAAAAAGAYFLYGSKNATKNRKVVKSWMLKAKAEILEKLEEAKEMSQAEYEALVESAVGAYAAVQSVTKKDLKEFQDEMKLRWKDISKAATPPKKSAVKKAVKTTSVAPKKPAVKKTTKKST